MSHAQIAAGVMSNAVDLYNSETRQWSTAQLSLVPNTIAATSVGNLALFAGDGKLYIRVLASR